MTSEGEQLADAGGGAAGGRKAVVAGKAAAKEAAEVERIGGQQVKGAEAGLHPDHAADQVIGGDEGAGEQMHVAARSR